MFMLELQGESKGLSVGGLAVINKSMSLTVSSLLPHLTVSFTCEIKAAYSSHWKKKTAKISC